MKKKRTRLSGTQLLANAQAVLVAPLQFGNDAQIKALKFLLEAEELAAHLDMCPACQSEEICPAGRNMGSNFELYDAAWALMVQDGKGYQGK